MANHCMLDSHQRMLIELVRYYMLLRMTVPHQMDSSYSKSNTQHDIYQHLHCWKTLEYVLDALVSSSVELDVLWESLWELLLEFEHDYNSPEKTQL